MPTLKLVLFVLPVVTAKMHLVTREGDFSSHHCCHFMESFDVALSQIQIQMKIRMHILIQMKIRMHIVIQIHIQIWLQTPGMQTSRKRWWSHWLTPRPVRRSLERLDLERFESYHNAMIASKKLPSCHDCKQKTFQETFHQTSEFDRFYQFFELHSSFMCAGGKGQVDTCQVKSKSKFSKQTTY